MHELPQSLHYRIAQKLTTGRVVHSQRGFDAARLEQLAIAIPGFIYAIRIEKQGVTWI
jgi:hypothetical protein